MGKYTDEQNVMIAKKEYEKYDVNDAVTIEDKNTGNYQKTLRLRN